MSYLVGVEWPWTGIANTASLMVVVTDDYEGFGPDLLASWDGQDTPIARIDDEPLEAALRYIDALSLDPESISINLDEYEYYTRTEGGWQVVVI